ncbi:nuclear speckle splicing regulatory protein 1 [Scaptodrosophila lebanonensis]|uniref:Nuclear speckle splicing regulatory protein 1 n=1 Tax=Drosophila lebanonensis TaxID=7225 RepID=A0A6J2TV35_DROLE|nr:nuclear speckle splicing regulatory protein 1 [Scaptodrosophila lebanonensis]
MSKQYGLIVPGQQKKTAAPPPATKPSIFDENTSSESDNDAPQMRAKAGTTSGPSLMERRVARRMQEKALAEDPTIFQYDELYDEMDNKREEAKQTKSQEPRKPKYIGRLMEHAERRKLENELRIERQVQKEREAEGEKFQDKDTYVTATYRKKLESIRLLQEQEQRDEYLEAIGDVTKQKDLDGFYRHLYEQKLGTDQDKLKPKTAPTADDVAYKPIKAEKQATEPPTKIGIKQRSYRRRHSDEERDKDKTVEEEEVKPSSSTVKAHLTNNIDADSDFSIDDSSDDDDEKSVNRPVKELETKTKIVESKPKIEQPEISTESKAVNEPKAKSLCEKSAADMEKPSEVQPVPTPPRERIDLSYIWKKRTVGEVFDAAVARYQERKKARQA